ncbi:unnamed protein product, partial [Heterosigma akashiwo]
MDRLITPRYRATFPELVSQYMFATDGGLETVLIFEKGKDLPEFASFVLLESDAGDGPQTLGSYYLEYMEVACSRGFGVILETATWRASQRWADMIAPSKYPPERLEQLNWQAAQLVHEVRESFLAKHEQQEGGGGRGAVPPILISGSVGPAGDGYRPAELLTAEEARAYHAPQVRALKRSAADFVTGLTLCYAEEAIGLALAANDAGVPVVISFTVETDGALPNGESLASAISRVDAAARVEYFMVNCAHPTHFAPVLTAEAAAEGGGQSSPIWRIRGIKVNASCKSHAELDKSTELDAGDPVQLGAEVAILREQLLAAEKNSRGVEGAGGGGLRVMGGCCGTAAVHIAQIIEQVA